jgi:hypothetical protein
LALGRGALLERVGVCTYCARREDDEKQRAEKESTA